MRRVWRADHPWSTPLYPMQRAPHRVQTSQGARAHGVLRRDGELAEDHQGVLLGVLQEREAMSIVLDAETEYQWRRQVIAWAKAGGWMVTAMHDSRKQVWGTDKGFPDLFIVRGEQALAPELKRSGGQRTADQKLWALALEAAGISSPLWRPRDCDQVQAILLAGVPVRELVKRDIVSQLRVQDQRKKRSPSRSRG